MFETAEVIPDAREFVLENLPTDVAPHFQHKDNIKLNKGSYKLYKTFQNDSQVYLYDFKKTTAASDASHANLELDSKAVTGPIFVEETSIIKQLPSDSIYHHFVISKTGLGIYEHHKAVAEATNKAVAEVAENLIDNLKKVFVVTPEIEDDLRGVVRPTEIGFECSSVTMDWNFEFHEADCTKQFFLYARKLYPKLEIVSEQSFPEVISRYALSREDLAIYNKAKETSYIVGEHVVEELHGYAAEGKPTSAKGQANKSEYQLIANMAKASAIIAHNRIMEQGLFSKTTVIGLLLDYEMNEVVKLFKMECDFITGCTVITKADCNEKIDKMLARIDYQFSHLSS